jgi:hypothetical protein
MARRIDCRTRTAVSVAVVRKRLPRLDAAEAASAFFPRCATDSSNALAVASSSSATSPASCAAASSSVILWCVSRSTDRGDTSTWTASLVSCCPARSRATSEIVTTSPSANFTVARSKL